MTNSISMYVPTQNNVIFQDQERLDPRLVRALAQLRANNQHLDPNNQRLETLREIALRC